ncbi:hypothetical protein [Streptomyces sp. SAI-119]|uniref:hypothetical protein n=1 Tax=Streptomyces sp. SAI-119 TaxID=2940541 RepID=UPI0024731E6A|nr:hypothetical protein [Streptomyces sp. SAI-119]
MTVGASQALAATRHCADRIAAEQPHENTGGRLLELLDALGLPTTAQQLRALKARAAIEHAVHARHRKETP